MLTLPGPHSCPKSGWSWSPPMKLMKAAEWGSSGAALMSRFHQLSGGNSGSGVGSGPPSCGGAAKASAQTRAAMRVMRGSYGASLSPASDTSERGLAFRRETSQCGECATSLCRCGIRIPSVVHGMHYVSPRVPLIPAPPTRVHRHQRKWLPRWQPPFSYETGPHATRWYHLRVERRHPLSPASGWATRSCMSSTMSCCGRLVSNSTKRSPRQAPIGCSATMSCFVSSTMPSGEQPGSHARIPTDEG
jgi:hypothetical protein